MKIGDIAIDTTINQVVIIVDKDIVWKDLDGQVHMWDFEVLDKSGHLDYADIDELTNIDNHEKTKKDKED